MASGPGSFSRHSHLSELSNPLPTAEGVLSPATRKNRALSNLGRTFGEGGLVRRVQPTPAAKTTSTTLTAAELLTGIITGNQGAAGAATYTLPLASALETALLALYPDLAVNDAFDFSVINLSTVAAEDITIATNTGWTLVGSMLVIEQAAGNPGGSNGHFRVRRTAANTYTLYRIA